MKDTVFAKRTSVRNFKPDNIPRELIQELLQAAIEAPSAGNCQPWHFYAVSNPERKQQLSTYAYCQKFIQAAPVVFVVCAEPALSEKRYEQRGRELYCIQDTAAAIENMLLCATQNGLGACWCGAFDDAMVAEVMQLPATQRPVAIIPVGYEKGNSKKPKRRRLDEVVTFID